MANLIGKTLGRYHILEQLGEGGMATVYKAYDTRLEREVAVKVIRTDLFGKAVIERILKRFEREAKSLAKLSQPNIVGVIDYGEHDDAPYLVLEYLPGGTLKERMKGQPMPWQEAVRLLIPIANALDYAHEQKVIHRDVKPANILLTKKGLPMLSDFGIAKILEVEETATLTGTGMGVGTPEYMAPEQWTGGTTAQSDIYSLGIVLYEMVTGRKPYTADTPAAILLKQATEPLPRPGTFIQGLPENVEKTLIKALARKPENRYQTMGRFSRALEALSNPNEKKSSRTLTGAEDYETEDATYATIDQGDTQDTYLQEEKYSTKWQSTTYDETPHKKPVAKPQHQPVTQEKKVVWWPWAAGIAGVLCLVLIGVTGIGGSLLAGNFSSSAATEARVAAESSIATEAPAAIEAPAATEAPLAATEAPVATEALAATEVPRASNPSGKIVYTCQVSGNSELNDICIMNSSGSGVKQLTNNGVNNGWPSISPDGNTVLFSSNVSGSWQIYSISPSGQSLQQLTFGPDEAFAPDMSPDGQIVYKNGNSQADSIWVMNSNGGGAYQVYGNGWDPVWSPDGSQILFASGNLNSATLYIINANGGGLTELTNMSEIRGRSDWSSQNLIAFYAGASWQRNLYTVATDGSNLAQITNGGNSQGPSFSPDGEWIAFTGYFDSMNNTSGCEIYIARTDGSDRKRLTSNSYCDWQPRWGP